MDDAPDDTHSGGATETVETWASRKGMLDRFLSPSGLFSQPNPSFVLWSAARAYAGWPIGFQTTEADFDMTVQAAMGAAHG